MFSVSPCEFIPVFMETRRSLQRGLSYPPIGEISLLIELDERHPGVTFRRQSTSHMMGQTELCACSSRSLPATGSHPACASGLFPQWEGIQVTPIKKEHCGEWAYKPSSVQDGEPSLGGHSSRACVATSL